MTGGSIKGSFYDTLSLQLCFSHALFFNQGAEYNSDESDEMIPSPESCATYPPGTAEYHQALSPSSVMHTSIQPLSLPNMGREAGRGEECFDSQSQDWNLNRSAFFWTQLQKEEDQLRDISDAELLLTDEHGRT